MWIMLIKKLPTKISPPKLSIFWSEPYPDQKYIIRQFQELGGRYGYEKRRTVDGPIPPDFYLDENGNTLSDETLLKKITVYMQTNIDATYLSPLHVKGRTLERNWARARSIIYKGEKIRVFEDEFSVLTHANMSEYIGMNGGSYSHELVPDGVSSSKIIEEVMTGSLKDVYDAAMVDGCSHVQAVAMALGVEIEEPVSEIDLASFPATGWYRCRPEYAQFYCTEQEMEE